MQAVDEEIVLGETKATAATDVYRRYFFWLAVFPLLIYLAAFVVVRIPSYERWGGSSWGPILDYAFQATGENADVVIFGDSSALFAVDPMQMSKQLGLKVINLPNTIGGLPVIGDMALGRYLAGSRPPKLIVFYFTAWDLDYESAEGTRLFEGEEMLVRHGTPGPILRFAIRHPREVFYFPFRVYSGLGPGALVKLLRSGTAIPEVAGSRGHVANDLPFPPLAGDCRIPDADIQKSNIQGYRKTSVQNLVRKYSTPETKTLVYLAPVPACRNVDELLRSVAPGVGLPAVLPASEFTADDYYAHLKPNAVPATTELATLAVRSLLGSK
jgi:hypothetical protein